MRMIQILAGAAAFVGLLTAPALAQNANLKEIAARVELHPIASMTLSDQQVLAGDRNGKSVTLGGEFRIAQGQGRLPVVILMHGSGGVGANIEPWARKFNALGISTFVIDGFTGRGLVSVNADQAQLGRLNFIVDIYNVLGILAKHPRVDPERVILMGFSRGGQAALFASMKRLHTMWNTSGIRIRAYLPFYPDCMTTYRDDTDVDGPIRIFHGTPDDYNPVAACKTYLSRLKAAGRDVDLTEYPDAPHGFDLPLDIKPAPVAVAQTVRECRIVERDKGELFNAETSQPFTYKDSCVRLGPVVGPNAAARDQAYRDVLAYVQQVLAR